MYIKIWVVVVKTKQRGYPVKGRFHWNYNFQRYASLVYIYPSKKAINDIAEILVQLINDYS